MLVRTFKFVISPYTKGQTHLSHKEAFIASLGSFVGIAFIFMLTIKVTNNHNTAALIAASTGATAFLIFTLPNSVFSQNWSVIAGHMISAIIGVSCFKLLGNSIIATALSVALAVIGMHLLRSPHPPGAATALLAVIGGEPVTNLGYHYVLFPILGNILALLIIARGFNLIPNILRQFNRNKHQEKDHITSFNFTPFVGESRTEEPLLEGEFYSHSQHTSHASIRKILAISDSEVSYEVIHGLTKGSIHSVPYDHFTAWTRFRVHEVKHAT